MSPWFAIATLLLSATPTLASSHPPALAQQVEQERAAHPVDLAYFADRDARADVENALESAKRSGKTVVIVMGANWCHDSVALAGWLGTPRFTELMRDRYIVVYVDAGTPQTGKGRNLDIARRFGIDKVRNTPLVMLISPDETRINTRKDAIGWRNAASRSEDDIYRYFAKFTSI